MSTSVTVHVIEFKDVFSIPRIFPNFICFLLFFKERSKRVSACTRWARRERPHPSKRQRLGDIPPTTPSTTAAASAPKLREDILCC